MRKKKLIYRNRHSLDNDEEIDFINYLRGLDALTPAEKSFLRRVN